MLYLLVPEGALLSKVQGVNAGRIGLRTLVGAEVTSAARQGTLQEGEVGNQVVGNVVGSIAGINHSAIGSQTAKATGQRAIDGTGFERILLVEREEVILPNACHQMVSPSVL